MDDMEARLARAEARATYAMEVCNLLVTRMAIDGRLSPLDREAITFFAGALSAKGDPAGNRLPKLLNHAAAPDQSEQ